jgi:hypothetical protein
MERRKARTSVPAYYADVMRWLPVMQDPGKYFSTPCVNEIVALAEALRILHAEGLDARFARHARIARAFRAGLDALGLALFTDASCRADTLSVVLLPKGSPTPTSAGRPPRVDGLSRRALTTPEPFVRFFSRRVQQEGALDLTQGDYKNADFAPHPEVVRAAQRITRNTVHSYGPAVGRMDVRSEVAEFFNRDGLLDYPDSEVRFLPDEVLFTPGTRSGLAFVLEVLGADGSGVVVPSPSWEYDWFVERAGKRRRRAAHLVPRVPPRPGSSTASSPRGGISSVILNNPHNPTGRVYPRALVEELVRVAVSTAATSSTTRSTSGSTTWAGSSTRPSPTPRGATGSSRSPASRRWTCSAPRPGPGLLAGHLRPDPLERRAGEARSSRTSPPGSSPPPPRSPRTGPSPPCRARSPPCAGPRPTCASGATSWCGGGRARPARRRADRLRRDVLLPARLPRPRRRAVRPAPQRRPREGRGEGLGGRLRAPPLGRASGGIPFVAFAGGRDAAARYGTWQRLSYGSKDVKELAVFMDRVKARIEEQGRLGSSAPAPARAPSHRAHRSTRSGRASARRRLRRPRRPRPRGVRRRPAALPRGPAPRGAPAHRDEAPRLDRPPRRAARPRPARRPEGAPDRARLALTHLEWNPLMEARLEYEESIADLLGPCSEVLLDFEGRQISPEWLDLPEKVVLALLRHGVVPGEDRHLLFRVPNPFIEQDEEKIVEKILASVARANVLFHLACERVGVDAGAERDPRDHRPQVNSTAEIGAVVKVGTLYLQAVAALFDGPAGAGDAFLGRRVPAARRAEIVARGGPRPPRSPVRERRRPRAPARPARGLLPRARAGPGSRTSPPRNFRTRSTAPRPSSASSSRCRTPPSRAGRSPPTSPARSPSRGARRPSAASPRTRGGWASPPRR